MSAPKKVRSTCSYCGVGCGVTVSRDAAGRLQLSGDEDHPVNRGMLCSKGRALHHVVADQRDRLLYPQMRRSRGHPLERISWDTALNRAAAVFKSIITRYGPDAVGFYVSGQCLTEEYYVANKLMKGFIGSNNIDTNSRLCMSSAVVGYKLALGGDLCPISYDDIEHGDCYLIAGANPAYCHPILFRRLEAHKQARPEAKIIVVDPRRTQTCAMADLHLQIQPGTDVILYNAIGRVLIERGWIDSAFIAAHTEGFEAAHAAMFAETVEQAAAQCRIDPRDLIQAAEWIGKARGFQSWWAMGLNQSACGVDKNLALLNLSLLTGQIGKPGAGPFSLTGQPNAMGGREVGGLATMLAAHHDLSDESHRQKVAAFWGAAEISEKPGLTATEMFGALQDGRMRAIWIICTNPMVSLPNLAGAEAALGAAKFVVVQDISNSSDTVPFADLVLPAAGWLEKQGTMTNSERRVSLLDKLVEPPGEALPDAEILCRFATKMGWGSHFNYGSPEQIFNEHRELTRGTAIDMCGISYGRLQHEGPLQWPCTSEGHPGTQRLFSDGEFATPSRRARLHGVAYVEPVEPPSECFPLVLTTGRIRDQWHTMTRTGKVNKLLGHDNEPFVEVHPEDAVICGVRDGEMARVANARGEVRARVRLSDAIKQGTVFLPMHWSKSIYGGTARANLLTSDAVDPRSKEPDFKYAAVRLAAVKARPKKIVVIGAGAAALQFITSYREYTTEDSITVLGNETAGFYNRIQLPDYISARRDWENLKTCSEAELRHLDVKLQRGVKVARIDRAEKRVHDELGGAWDYDTLVIATGSRAVRPDDAPAEMEGVHCLRSTTDADTIKAQIKPGKQAVIIGGGLLGIELAASLRECGLSVRLLHRSARLMGAQLDVTASSILHAHLESLGIDVCFHESAATIHGQKSILGIRTTTGRYIPCDLLVYALGTTPNVELAAAAGLQCGNGVIVDDALRTSDESIYAMGEVAEHRGLRHGTTHAAQQQADVVAAQIAGHAWKRYQGTVPLHVLKVDGLPLATVGHTQHAAGQIPGYEEVLMSDPHERQYVRYMLSLNRIVAATMVGDLSQLEKVKEWIGNEIELDEERRKLLRPSGESRQPVRGKLVCSCTQVGADTIDEAIDEGCDTLASLCGTTRAGTGCGSCRPELQGMLRRRVKAVA